MEEVEFSSHTDRLSSEIGRYDCWIPVLVIIEVNTTLLRLKFSEFRRILNEAELGWQLLEALLYRICSLNRALLFLLKF